MIDLSERLQRFASGTSRRGFLERAGSTLIGIGLLSITSGQRAHASSCPGCAGYTKCGSQQCGSTPPETNACCSNNPPCLSCGGTEIVTGDCPTGYSPGWYWYCCVNGSKYICQDCCHPDLGCRTARSIVGVC